MSIVIQNDAGEDVTVYTAEEVEQQKASAAEEAVKPIKEEHEKLQRIHADQANNFKLLKNMTEEEKQKLSVSEIEQRKIAEKALEENETLKARIDQSEKQAKDSALEAEIKRYAGDDKGLREKLEARLGQVAIDDVAERVLAAATLAGIATQNINPLTQSMNGEAPRQFNTETEAAKKKEFFDSEKGKAAQAMLDALN